MKIKFDSHQQYQLDAVNSIVDVFKGQPRADESVFMEVALSELFNVLSVRNELVLSKTQILENIKAVQEQNALKVSDSLEGIELAAKDTLEAASIALNFSVEMETGTGKTYVYLRSIFELHRRYGFRKFIIAVPSVAIREGVLSSLRLMRDHFAGLFDNVPVNSWVYDSRQVSKLRGFADSNDLQILIMNIDAFNKASNNVIFREHDGLSGLAPIEFIKACCPIVIVDEPQNFEAEPAKRALAALNPLCTLRFSATHKNPYNCLYQLNPVKAYELKLVKQIEVTSVLEEANFNVPFIKVLDIKATKTKITAKLEIDIFDGVVKRKAVTVNAGDDLQTLTGGRDLYANHSVEEIDAGAGTVSFSNGVTLEKGQAQGVNLDELMQVQVRETVNEHLRKELEFASLPVGERIKVLSLFFIDRVANYRGDDAKIKRWFEAAYLELAAKPAFAGLQLPDVTVVHDGYFAEDGKGNAKDTNGGTQADDSAYEKIMQDKERLLSLEEPLRFIFSHSALREGWDNPNVFQICTLNETKSEVKKRQEIGRGLRLPVRENGERSHDANINRLTVIANESYKDFAKALQNQIAEETGETFPTDRIKNTRDRRKLVLKKGWELNPEFKELWERIKHKTRYSVEFDTTELTTRAANALKAMPAIEAPRYKVEKGKIIALEGQLETQLTRASAVNASQNPSMIDLLGVLQRETELTRSTLTTVLMDSGRLSDARKNPQQFLELTIASLSRTLESLIVEGIKYERSGEAYDMLQFQSHELESYLNNIESVAHSIYDGVIVQSEIERKFVQGMDVRQDVRLILKLPDWFEVTTPLGKYLPDWAIVMTDDIQEKLYFVCETKGSTDMSKLRITEKLKIDCGKAHFIALEVPYVVETDSGTLTAQKVLEK